MKVCIIGGGNLAHACAGEIPNSKIVDRTDILTRKPKLWNGEISVYYNHKFHHKAKLDNVTNDYSILKDAEIIFLAIPVYCRFPYLMELREFISKDALLIVSPSIGGINSFFEDYFPDNRYVCLQRVPYICRTIEYGKSVNTDVKRFVEAYFSSNSDSKTYDTLKALLNMDIIKIDSFYPLILSNSNPILHAAGVYNLIKSQDGCWDEIPYLYDKWNDYTSKIALDMDYELSKIMEKLHIAQYHPLFEYYGVKDEKSLTLKLKSIVSFKQVQAPVIKNNEGKYVLDKNSRYFIEDIPYGTCYIKLFAQKLNIKTPVVDEVIRALQFVMDKTFVDENGVLDIEELKKTVSYLPDYKFEINSK